MFKLPFEMKLFAVLVVVLTVARVGAKQEVEVHEKEDELEPMKTTETKKSSFVLKRMKYQFSVPRLPDDLDALIEQLLRPFPTENQEPQPIETDKLRESTKTVVEEEATPKPVNPKAVYSKVMDTPKKSDTQRNPTTTTFTKRKLMQGKTKLPMKTKPLVKQHLLALLGVAVLGGLVYCIACSKRRKVKWQ